MTRRSIHTAELPEHKNPIPQASIVRGVLVSSVISGIDLKTGVYEPDKLAQFKLAFSYLPKLMKAANGTLEDIVKVELYFSDKGDRGLANPHWLELFPDENSRPARHAHAASLPEGCYLQIQITAILEE